jgi:hypothetical protein
MKHIKLFEKFQTKEVSKREQSILNRGLDVMTEEQAAFCFCLANGWTHEIKVSDSDTKFTTLAPQIKDWPAWTKIKQQSINFAVRKFEILMDKRDRDEVYQNETIYPKIERFYNEFSDMPKDEVIALASMCIASPDQDTYDAYTQAKVEKREIKDIQNLGKNIDGTVGILLKKMGAAGTKEKALALQKAKAHYIKTYNADPAEVDKIYAEWIVMQRAKSVRK